MEILPSVHVLRISSYKTNVALYPLGHGSLVPQAGIRHSLVFHGFSSEETICAKSVVARHEDDFAAALFNYSVAFVKSNGAQSILATKHWLSQHFLETTVNRPVSDYFRHVPRQFKPS